jgi:hypothetical protein
MLFPLSLKSLAAVYPEDVEKLVFKGLGFRFFPFPGGIGFPFVDKGGGSGFYFVP